MDRNESVPETGKDLIILKVYVACLFGDGGSDGACCRGTARQTVPNTFGTSGRDTWVGCRCTRAQRSWLRFLKPIPLLAPSKGIVQKGRITSVTLANSASLGAILTVRFGKVALGDS